MAEKCLIIYASRSGNTTKVANRFKTTFERNGWQCDLFRVDKKTDPGHPPFQIRDYDFVCVGTGLFMHEPYSEITTVIRWQIYGADPWELARLGPERGPVRALDVHHRIVLGPESKKALVFATYAGYEFGPKEAKPALELLALEIEHLEFQCIGQFCCPGRYLNNPTPRTYHGDIRKRPDERDLLKAEMFVEEKLEEIVQKAPGAARAAGA
jgi:hypothetical protein